MRAAEHKTSVLTTEDGEKFTVEYAILVEDTFLGENYGISISSGRDGSKTHICGITTCTARIYELFELMVSHQVTPVSAMDIVEDWLAY